MYDLPVCIVIMSASLCSVVVMVRVDPLLRYFGKPEVLSFACGCAGHVFGSVTFFGGICAHFYKKGVCG